MGCSFISKTTPQKPQIEDKHPIKIGETVAIFALGPSGPFIEGDGTVSCHSTTADHYWVRFAGEPMARLRFVHPDWQASPDRALALLYAFWGSSRSRAPIIEDFFPDSSR